MIRLALLALLLGGVARAAPTLLEPPPGERDAGLVWAPVVVRLAPPAAVDPAPPYVPPGAPSVRADAVRVGPDRAAALWLDRLDVLRVVPVDAAGEPVQAPPLRAARVVGDAGARAVIDEDEALLPVDGRTWMLVQGPAEGAVWRLSADRPVRLRIERLARRPARVIWETARRDLLDRALDPTATLPAVAGATAMTRALDLARALAERVGAPDDPRDPTAAALRAWTAAVALDLWAGEAPFDGDVYALDDPLDGPAVELALPETALGAFADWIELPDGAERALRFEGGGAVRLEARALDPGRAAPVVRLAERLPDGPRDRVVLAPRSVPATIDYAPDAAFPDRRPLTTRAGRPLGPKADAVWSPAREAAEATLTVRGGPALVRLTHGRLRPMLDEALGHPVSVAERLTFARDRLAGRDDPPARRARLLVEGLADADAACDAAIDDPVLAAWAAVRCLTARPDPDRFDALPAAFDAAGSTDPRLVWALRLDATDAALRAGRADATALLPEVGPDLPPDLAQAVERRRPRPPVDATGAAAARAEEAWRRAPTDRDARARVLRTLARTVWSAVRPAPDAAPPRRWLTTGLDPRPDDDALARLTPLRPGAEAAVDLPPPPAEVGRSTRLRMVAHRPGGAAFALTVDGTPLRVEAGAAVEELSFAAAPGGHTIGLPPGDGQPTLWLDARPVEGASPETSGRVERAWPVEGPRGPLRVDFPLSMERRRMKLALRGVDLERTRLEVHTDIGPILAVDLRFGGPDPHALPLDDGPAPSAPVEVILDVPPTTGGITLRSPDGARLLVRPTLRTPALIEAPPTAAEAPAPTGGGAADPLAVVTRTSAVLAHRPADWQARLRRAHALLDLDLTHIARPDIDRLRFDAPPDMAARVDGLLARYATARDPDVLPMAPPPGARIVPLDALVVPGDTPADAPRARLAREGRALRAQGDAAAAARAHLALYREAGTLAAAREALIDLRDALRVAAEQAPDAEADGPPSGLASLAFGAVARMDDDDRLTGVSGVRGPASAGSEWLTIEAMEAAAGYETLRLPAISPHVPPSVQVRAAMLAAPWPAADGHRLTPGRGAALTLRLLAPTTLAAEVWCAPDPEDRPCRLRVRDGAAEPEIRRVPAGMKTAVPLGTHRGRVAIDVVLTRGGAQSAGLRFVADRAIADETTVGGGGQHVIRPFRQRRVFRALHRRPVEVVAEGPGAVRIEGWRPVDARARAIAVTITGPDGAARTETLPLATGAAWARGEGRRPLRVTETRRRVIPIPTDGPHRIRLEPDAGEALMRLSVRVDRPGTAREPPPPMTWRLAPFDPAGLPTPLVPPEAAEARAPGPWGTLTLQLGWLQAIEDGALDASEDAGDGAPPMIGEFAAIGRRRWDDALGADRLYLRLAPGTRATLDGDAVVGGRGALRLDGALLGLGLELDGEGWADPIEGAWSARARLTAWRGFRLAPDWRLTPSARVWLGRYADDAVVDRRIDPALGTDWRRDHSRGWRLGGSLRWQMLRAQHLRARLDAYSNDDFASLDRVDPSLSWTALFGLSPISTVQSYVGYRPSVRFADDDRREGGLTHQISVGLDAGFWLNRDTRLVLGGRFRPFIGLGGDLAPRFVLTAAIDLTGGRALTDFTPIEEPYPDLAGRRFWLPPREVDR